MSTGAWHEINVGDVFTFSSPVKLSSTGAEGIDSAVGEWHGDGLVVRSDYGLFADPLTGHQNRTNRSVFEESIGGVPARIVANDQSDGSRFTAVHFSDLTGPGGKRQKLTFVVVSSGERTPDEALRMVRSIRFRGH